MFGYECVYIILYTAQCGVVGVIEMTCSSFSIICTVLHNCLSATC